VLTDSGAGFTVFTGVKGLDVPEVEYVTIQLPGIDGAPVTDVYASPRTVLMPMKISGATRGEFLDRKRAFELALDPLVAGQLELMQSDGRRFRLNARYLGGLEGSEEVGEGGDTTWCRFVLKLYVEDPWWYAVDPITIPFNFTTPTTFFPFFPLTLDSNQVLGNTTVNNPGTVPSWPTWTATAPGSGLTLTNTATGDEVEFSGSIPSGRTLTIVTEPGEQSVKLDDGTDWWPNLVGNPVFWKIPPLSTPISLVLTGAGAGSSVGLSWLPRFRSPS
jgi:hypothetical protein